MIIGIKVPKFMTEKKSRLNLEKTNAWLLQTVQDMMNFTFLLGVI
jgi:hypothetical protein